jgi:ABC-type branched-subunit amino acid transport system substrate-binding protein
VFVDGFFAGSPDPIVREFVALYHETHGQEPSILEAQAFDTAGLLLYLLGRPDVDSREDLRRALASVRNYPGVTGTLSVDERGEIMRELFLIRVEQGAFVQIDRERNRALPMPLDF